MSKAFPKFVSCVVRTTLCVTLVAATPHAIHIVYVDFAVHAMQAYFVVSYGVFRLFVLDLSNVRSLAILNTRLL